MAARKEDDADEFHSIVPMSDRSSVDVTLDVVNSTKKSRKSKSGLKNRSNKGKSAPKVKNSLSLKYPQGGMINSQ